MIGAIFAAERRREYRVTGWYFCITQGSSVQNAGGSFQLGIPCLQYNYDRRC
jgi:hypothetical protein